MHCNGRSRKIFEARCHRSHRMGTWAKVERDTLRMGARELGAAVELWYLDVDIDELWRRVTPDSWRTHRLPVPISRHGFSQFEVPDDDELALFDPH